MIKHRRRVHAFFHITILCSLSSTSFATTTWQCTAFDNDRLQWSEQSNYQLTALNRAFQACKSQSQHPQSCRAPKENCDMMMDGVISLRPMWRCMALDEAAMAWFSNTYDKAADALIAAHSYCKTYSALPSTCYVDPVICRNLNLWNQ